MYINNFNDKNNGSRFFFILLAGIAAVLVVALLLASPGLIVTKEEGSTSSATDTNPAPEIPGSDITSPPETATTTPAAADTSAVPQPQETTSAPQTTVPAQTTETPTETTNPPETVDAPQTSQHYTPADPKENSSVLSETADAGEEYLDKIIFLGDSTTYSFLYYGKLSGGKESLQVWTPASRTLTLDHALTTTILYPDTEEEITVKEAVTRKKPEIMVITLGVNGISYMDEPYFISVYKKLVNMIKDASPDTQIILQSIFPVATNWEKTKSINNEKIGNANKWIQEVAKDCGVRYLDTISVLAIDEGGYLPLSYQNSDGLHLNSDGCDIVLNYIRTHALPDYAE